MFLSYVTPKKEEKLNDLRVPHGAKDERQRAENKSTSEDEGGFPPGRHEESANAIRTDRQSMNNPDSREREHVAVLSNQDKKGATTLKPNEDEEESGSKRISEKIKALNDDERYSEQMDFIVRSNQRRSPSSLQGRSFSEKDMEMKKQLGSNQQLGEGCANLDRQSVSNQAVVSVAELQDGNEIEDEHLRENPEENGEVNLRAEQPKLDRGDDGQHGRRREYGLSPEIRDDRSVHALMEVRSRSSEVKSERNEENKCLQNMKNMIGVCASLCEDMRSLRIGDYDCQALSIQLSGADHAGYIAETCEIGGAYEEFGDSGEAASVNVVGYVAEVLRKGGAAISEDAEGNVESAMLLKAVAKEDMKNPDYERNYSESMYDAQDHGANENGGAALARTGRKEI